MLELARITVLCSMFALLAAACSWIVSRTKESTEEPPLVRFHACDGDTFVVKGRWASANQIQRTVKQVEPVMPDDVLHQRDYDLHKRVN